MYIYVRRKSNEVPLQCMHVSFKDPHYATLKRDNSEVLYAVRVICNLTAAYSVQI